MAVSPQYMNTLVDTLNVLFPTYVFGVDPSGRKVTRITRAFRPATPGATPSNRSVFMFVDNETGAFLKAASWKRPAPGARFTPATLEEAVEILQTKATSSGGFLYKR